MKTKKLLSDHRDISSYLRGIYDDQRMEYNIIVANNAVAMTIILLASECTTQEERNNLHRAITPLIKFV